MLQKFKKYELAHTRATVDCRNLTSTLKLETNDGAHSFGMPMADVLELIEELAKDQGWIVVGCEDTKRFVLETIRQQERENRRRNAFGNPDSV